MGKVGIFKNLGILNAIINNIFESDTRVGRNFCENALMKIKMQMINVTLQKPDAVTLKHRTHDALMRKQTDG